jgi:formylglycine-generating enzyme required for sulfatase activity
VIHEQGYWLFDTPVTQALWHEVMGENLSQFKSLKRPVENLSWEDCQKFLININEQIPGINLCLPTESQWEYACRAATETALYNGDIEIIGDANAPALNNIAWYGGNSGVGFELENNYNITHLKNRQYKDNPSGTHPVALKLPNNWGLYDMLGNVSEWTSDSLHNSEEDRRVNSGKVLRVIRGGSYNDSALVCNSAARYWYPQDFHFNFIGFRCARKDKGN